MSSTWATHPTSSPFDTAPCTPGALLYVWDLGIETLSYQQLVQIFLLAAVASLNILASVTTLDYSNGFGVA